MSLRFQSPRQTEAWVRSALKSLRPLLRDVLDLEVGPVISVAGEPACGLHGCIVELSDPNLVMKLTDDSGEAIANKVLRAAQLGRLPPSGARFPQIHSIYMVDLPGLARKSAFAIIREAIQPEGAGPWRLSDEDRSAVLEMAFDLSDERRAGTRTPIPSKQPSWRFLNSPSLQPLRQAYQDLYQMELGVFDIHPANLGFRLKPFKVNGKTYPSGLLVHDLGSSAYTRPVTITRIRRRGAANRGSGESRARSQPCPRQDELAQVVEDILGSTSRVRSCEVVGQRKMKRVVRRHGWPDASGVVGFHTPKDKLYVTHLWSLPHEWVHATGLVDDKIGIWLCEGLTEFVAEEAARRGKFPHHPTYPGERKVIADEVGPAARMEPLTMARLVVQSYQDKQNPAHVIAGHIKQNPRYARIPFKDLVRSLGPKSGEDSGQFSRLIRA